MADTELSSFIEAEYPRLVGLLGFYTGDPWIAEELAQEALVRLWQHWRKVRRLDNPSAWLNRVAINLANSRYRRLVSERKAQARMEQERPAEESSAEPPDAHGLRAAIARLPKRQRAALILRYYLDLPFSGVAATLDVPDSTARSLVSRGVARLRERERLGQFEEVLDG
ncbi:MAG: SigE family RNA polymerase sigma factor [Actinomycetota bacterium]